jgi:DNA/RNA endonuclease YhcR with UshA esterase domain
MLRFGAINLELEIGCSRVYRGTCDASVGSPNREVPVKQELISSNSWTGWSKTAIEGSKT